MESTKNYDPASIEEKWYKHWQDKGYFASTPDDRKPFTVVIPPPNVTGVLHMGHTLNETVQDILVRNARMNGCNACWVPGSDHASIATETRVVNMLKERGIEKNSLSRDEFLKYAYEWKDKYGGIIYHQIARLGCSVDWNRVAFTMDANYYKAVLKVFVTLYNKGWIYRGARMINWDPVAQTALSDEEVEHKDVEGTLYYIKYKVEGADSDTDQSNPAYITIATQRPETIMGDTAVCVNPEDLRYASLKGRHVIVPLVNRKVPVIFDEYVDESFGTGALKVTPAHDINDYNLGLKHNLPIIDTLNADGTLSSAAEVFVGLDRFEARKQVVEQLKDEDLLVREEAYLTRMGYSQRSNAVVEPRISTQWFVRMKELAEPALKAVADGEINIHPGEKFLATYKYWLENVKDWCISRQLWWGQQIPAWYDANGNVYVAESAEEAKQMARQASGDGSMSLTQDEDVLDTWFSSWLWPIEVFKGITDPGNADINYYYPTSVLVTGQDIIFFWVARMIMAGFELRNEKPFSDVYFTGMVRDKQGRKMSKSLGNSPDLLDLIDRYGADAVRFGIMIAAPAGNDLLFDESALEQGRNFNNKLWNALKLLKMLEARIDTSADTQTPAFATIWFENRLAEIRIQATELISQFKLSEALKRIYSLIWDDFCSWYLEWIKPGFEQAMNKQVYEQTVQFFESLMQLLHPFMPFITEEIYHLLRDHEDDLCVKQWNTISNPDLTALDGGMLLQNAITAIRDARNKNLLKPKNSVTLSIETASQHLYAPVMTILQKQVNASSLTFVDTMPQSTIVVTEGKDKFYIGTTQQIDMTAQKDAMQKERDYLLGFLETVRKKLGNERFVQNAKPDVIALERKKQGDAEDKIRVIEESLSSMKDA